MSLENEIYSRSNNECELCKSKLNLQIYSVLEANNLKFSESNILICQSCKDKLNNDSLESNDWHFLNDSIWSDILPVKILSWNLLNRLKNEPWANDLLDIAYLSEEEEKLVKIISKNNNFEQLIHTDSNGATLQNGDTVVLIKDLNVKGAGFTAKRGTSVRNIRLVPDNSEQIEGKINGQSIIILTQFVKK